MELKNQGYWIFERLEFLCCSKEHKAWAGLLSLGRVTLRGCVQHTTQHVKNESAVAITVVGQPGAYKIAEPPPMRQEMPINGKISMKLSFLTLLYT